MTLYYGTGVSRVLDPTGTQYTNVIFQQGRPPIDAEFSLAQDIATNWWRQVVMRGVPSGFLGNETNARYDFLTNAIWSNWFKFGPQRTGELEGVMWAVVNGWLIPVTGTRTGTPPGSPDDVDTYNVIALDPPPSNAGDFRIDFVFLEVWLARIPPNPSTLNKPSSSAVYYLGNVEGGYSYIADDIIDPAIGFETTERVQVQYRIRVVDGLVGLTTNPDGFDPTVVKAQGAGAAPTSYIFTNMRSTLGDPGLWRAGDGTQNALGTVDGYSYAVPISAVFRRNSVAWNGDPAQNLNGGFNRNPTAVDRTGIATYSTVATLAAVLTSTATTITLALVTGIPIPLNPATPVLIQIGDELLTYTAITTGVPPQITGLTRGVNGTRAEYHAIGAIVQVLSGRPDGLFSDQIALTDILDLRHAVNPNGFDYNALLKDNLDDLLRGQLRANWKRTGAGPQGPFCFYQDKITSGSVSLGVTKLDAFDGIRQIFSDAATSQRVECIVQANSLPLPAAIAAPGWQLAISANHTTRTAPGIFTPGDVITIPVAQLKAGLPGGDSDQVRWLYDGISNSVSIRLDGQSVPVSPSLYTVTGSVSLNQSLTPNDDMVITLGSNFPTVSSTAAVGPTQIYITLNVLYGPGRGLSRRPDSLHSLSFLSPASDLLIRPRNVPTSNQGTSVTWLPLWQKYRSFPYKNNVPTASEILADLGSKSVVVAPFRRVTWPSQIVTLDGTNTNPYTTFPITATTGYANGSFTFTDTTQNFVTSNIHSGDALILQSGPQQGRFVITAVSTTTLTVSATLPVAGSLSYTIEHIVSLVSSATGSATGTTTFTDGSVNFTSLNVAIGDLLYLVNAIYPAKYTVLAVGTTTLTVERNIFTGTSPETGITYVVAHTQGLMPVNASNGTSFKWTTTDPLGLFSGSTASSTATKNVYVTLPRHLAPGWGAFYVPILPADDSPYSEGINFMSLAVKGSAPYTNGDKNYVPYNDGGGLTCAVFSTLSPGPPIVTATYNTTISAGWCGMQKFNDTRGLGRQGLQLPPFYGIARLFAVYEAHDYFANGSAYNISTDRSARGGGAINLLRQNMNHSDGPTFWIEIDSDGDSTFILNANAIDITRSTHTAITSFSSADFVIESSIFGFDRGSFDITKEFRLVLTNPTSSTLMRSQASDPVFADRYAQLGTGPNVGAQITGPVGVIPGPATPSDQVVINYSRTPYQGDAWGSQTNYIDISQNVGPLQTGNAYQLVSTKLNQTSLTRPNQKIFQVLASTGFATTLGTGRISGDASTYGANIRDVGYENPAVYPPSSAIAARPVTLAGDFVTDSLEIGTEYLGATERLPLGALWRDKDFKGGSLATGSGTIASPLIYFDETGLAVNSANLAVGKSLEQTEILLDTSTTASGAPGDLIAHVDGEQNNYSLTVNFRTYRGGSVFTAGGGHPGGEVSVQQPNVNAPDGHTNVVQGRAYLVLNYTTSVGASEVSPGGELMLFVATNVQSLQDSLNHGGFINIGTNGTGEGYGAADFYRIDGHPMVRDNVRVLVDPTTISLSRRSV